MSLNFPTWEFGPGVVQQHSAGTLRSGPLGPISGRECGEAASARYPVGSYSRSHANQFAASFPFIVAVTKGFLQLAATQLLHFFLDHFDSISFAISCIPSCFCLLGFAMRYNWKKPVWVNQHFFKLLIESFVFFFTRFLCKLFPVAVGIPCSWSDLLTPDLLVLVLVCHLLAGHRERSTSNRLLAAVGLR